MRKLTLLLTSEKKNGFNEIVLTPKYLTCKFLTIRLLNEAPLASFVVITSYRVSYYIFFIVNAYLSRHSSGTKC